SIHPAEGPILSVHRILCPRSICATQRSSLRDSEHSPRQKSVYLRYEFVLCTEECDRVWTLGPPAQTQSKTRQSRIQPPQRCRSEWKGEPRCGSGSPLGSALPHARHQRKPLLKFTTACAVPHGSCLGAALIPPCRAG